MNSLFFTFIRPPSSVNWLFSIIFGMILIFQINQYVRFSRFEILYQIYTVILSQDIVNLAIVLEVSLSRLDSQCCSYYWITVKASKARSDSHQLIEAGMDLIVQDRNQEDDFSFFVFQTTVTEHSTNCLYTPCGTSIIAIYRNCLVAQIFHNSAVVDRHQF